jgi:hypothetical protein
VLVSLYVVGLVGPVYGLKHLWCVWWLAPVEFPGRNGLSMSIQAANVQSYICLLLREAMSDCFFFNRMDFIFFFWSKRSNIPLSLLILTHCIPYGIRGEEKHSTIAEGQSMGRAGDICQFTMLFFISSHG